MNSKKVLQKGSFDANTVSSSIGLTIMFVVFC